MRRARSKSMLKIDSQPNVGCRKKITTMKIGDQGASRIGRIPGPEKKAAQVERSLRP
jgi:hypothetical protein